MNPNPKPSEPSSEVKFEIGHVLFIDIVGYSKLVINEQRALLDTLNRIVRCTEQFQRAEQASRLIKIPTGDGMALVFYNSPEAPVECALETSRAPGVPEDFVPVRVFQWREDADMAHWRFLGWMKQECD
jgi:hypothetical protein